jgi:DNA-binding transcriptional ArsR family regulator
VTAWTSVARERTIATARTSGSGPGGGPSGLVDQDIANIDDAAYVMALAHPLRLKILAMLGERQSSPARLAAALGARVNVVAYHVRRLRELGIADLVEVRPGRGGLEHIYAVRRHPTFSDAAWEDLRPEARSRVVVAMLRQMSEYVARAALAGGFGRRDAVRGQAVQRGAS